MPTRPDDDHRDADHPRTPARRASVLERPRFHGASTRPAPVNADEEALARGLADEIAYAVAIAATNPHAPRECGECGVGASVRRAFGRLRPERQAAAAEHARRLLAASPDERRRYFGSCASPGSAARLSGPVITPERRALLRTAVRARLRAQQDEIERFNRFASGGGIALLSCRTTLEGVLSAELNQYYVETVIHQPATLTFRWSTTCEAAETAAWEVRRLPSHDVVASGAVANLGPFTIDFSAFLSADPGPAPQLFDVRVVPRTKPTTVKVPGDSPGSGEVAKVPSAAVGLPSSAVRVAYARDTAQVTKFYEEIVYRRLELHLDRLRLVEPQGAAGADEIWLYGGVVESHGGEEIVVHELPKFFARLQGRDARAAISYERAFHLENPTSARWPKTYTVILAVLEEDGGEDIANMLSGLWGELASWVLDDIWDEIKKFLEDLGIGSELSGSLVSTLSAIAAALAGSIVGAIGGLVLSFGFGIFAAITQAVADDFYEIRVLTFVLPTNSDEYVATLDGDFQPDGAVQLVSEYPRFHYWTMPSIGAYDGLVEVKLHWALAGRIDLNA